MKATTAATIMMLSDGIVQRIDSGRGGTDEDHD